MSLVSICLNILTDSPGNSAKKIKVDQVVDGLKTMTEAPI